MLLELKKKGKNKWLENVHSWSFCGANCFGELEHCVE